MPSSVPLELPPHQDLNKKTAGLIESVEFEGQENGNGKGKGKPGRKKLKIDEEGNMDGDEEVKPASNTTSTYLISWFFRVS